uniref:Major sperm protein n=1 Tax=Caenorhabditis tropicalis TaxID=1561998 RepID=A0A1I7UPI8_9PELO
MTTEKKSVKSQKEKFILPKFPLEVTPEKLVIPSSGHLDVKIRNPTEATLKINFDLNSYSFDVDLVYMEDGKEIIEPFCWEKQEKRRDVSHRYGLLDRHKNERISQVTIQSDHVIHLRITCEGKDEEIKNKLTFNKSHELGYLFIRCSLNIEPVCPKPEDTEYATGIQLDSSRYFLLSIDPQCEKAKELANKFSEHEKQHARKDRLVNCTYKEDKEWIKHFAPGDPHPFGMTRDPPDNPKRKKQMENWNKEIFTKYGPKLDQVSDDELKKIKEG